MEPQGSASVFLVMAGRDNETAVVHLVAGGIQQASAADLDGPSVTWSRTPVGARELSLPDQLKSPVRLTRAPRGPDRMPRPR